MNSPLGQINKAIPAEGNILIIHHWDTDGSSSAALLTDFLTGRGSYNIDYLVPDVGTYRAEPGKNFAVKQKKYGAVFMADYAVPSDDLKNLADFIRAPLIVFDHHERENPSSNGIIYVNPVSGGERGSLWPSCTWVIRENLKLNVSDHVIMGIAGDYGGRFLNGFIDKFPGVTNYLNDMNRSFKWYVTAKDYVDIHYKINDRAMLDILAAELLRLQGNPCLISLQEDWVSKHHALQVEVEDWMQNAPKDILCDRVEVRYIDSSRSIISELSRKFSAESEYDFAMVVDTGFFDQTAQIYVRRTDKCAESVQPFKQLAENLGAQTGGKEEVAGILIRKNLVPKYLHNIISYFNDSLLK